MKYNGTDFMRDVEKVADRAHSAKIECSLYLGEYKERVIKALTFDEVNEKGIYYEIEEAMEDKNAYKLLISHQADFVNIKKYIEIAKKKGMSYKMIDSLEYSGDIALVVAAKDAIEHGENDNILVQPKLEVIKQKNLPEIYYKSMEKCICEFHLDIVRKELPNYIKNYKEIGFLDKLFGSKCPICQKLGGKKRG